MARMLVAVLIMACVAWASAFVVAPGGQLARAAISPSRTVMTSTAHAPNEGMTHGLRNGIAGASFAALGTLVGASAAVAEYIDPDDVGEIAKSDLPPIWVPIVFAAVLFLGVGLQQVSLGDVMDEEAQLGSMSGARAARQSARDRSMFQKK